MKKKTYIAPAMSCHKMELQQLMTDSDKLRADGTVTNSEDGTQTYFREGQTENDGEESGAKWGFNPWTEWNAPIMDKGSFPAWK